jgi:hypothetical protein
VTCLRCGAPAVVAAMRTNGFTIGKPWMACSEHAPRPSLEIDLIDLRVPELAVPEVDD